MAIFEANERSISPVITTNVMPTATIVIKGTVDMNEMYISGERKASGASTTKNDHRQNRTDVIRSWFLFFEMKLID